MIWQDIAITIVLILFSYALLPQVIKGFKTKKKTIVTQTALISFGGLYILSFIYLTLELYFATIISFITATLWLILFIQTIIYK